MATLGSQDLWCDILCYLLSHHLDMFSLESLNHLILVYLENISFIMSSFSTLKLILMTRTIRKMRFYDGKNPVPFITIFIDALAEVDITHYLLLQSCK